MCWRSWITACHRGNFLGNDGHAGDRELISRLASRFSAVCPLQSGNLMTPAYRTATTPAVSRTLSPQLRFFQSNPPGGPADEFPLNPPRRSCRSRPDLTRSGFGGAEREGMRGA